jgi:two-component system, LuxR family, sensor kinase FixL
MLLSSAGRRHDKYGSVSGESSVIASLVVLSRDTNGMHRKVTRAMARTSKSRDRLMFTSMGSSAVEGSTDAAIATLEVQLAAEREARRAAEESLRETHAAMIKHQQIGRMGDFRFNTRTRDSRGSLECYKLFGFDPELDQIDFSTWTEKIHPDDRPRIVKTLLEAISTHAPIRFEYRVELGGETRYIRCDGQPDHDHVGDLVYYGVLTDVTERRAAEETLRRAEAELASALRLASMGELAASIIHEINQPLTAIATRADACRRWLAAGPDGKDRAIASLDRVIDESHRAAAVVVGLKSLIRDADPAIAPLDVADAMQEVASLVMTELAREGVLLETEFPSDLPPALGDRVQIQQVVMNLVRNAIDAMRTITRRRVLTIGASATADELVLFVADNGIGIVPDHMPKLFDALYTTKPGGMGLGLAISRKIATANNGRLRACARNDAGAMFSLSLPVANENLER